MAHKIESLRGMDDIRPGEVEKWQWLEQKARNYFEGWGFKEIRTPLLEYTDLFTRSVGESSDIVSKEMFSFKDRGDRDITLRPEMTASVARCVIEKGLLSQAKSLQFYYIGPMFRAERPQAGRKRQFHQIGIEIINEPEGMADENSIMRLYGFLKFVGVEKPIVRLNDLGTVEQQAKAVEKLKVYFKEKINELCKDCQWRLEKNVLRILDCKIGACQPVIESAPWKEIFEETEKFKNLQKQLALYEVPFEIKRRLVRGLDYYNGPVFEVSAEGLGAQDALAGGGRYDRLYSDLGGKPTPCTGFSIGMERLLMVLEKSKPPLSERIREKFVYFAPLEGVQMGLQVVRFRERGIRATLGPSDWNLPKHLEKASKMGARFVVFGGSQEGPWSIKNMDTKEQKDKQSEKELVSYITGESLS